VEVVCKNGNKKERTAGPQVVTLTRAGETLPSLQAGITSSPAFLNPLVVMLGEKEKILHKTTSPAATASPLFHACRFYGCLVSGSPKAMAIAAKKSTNTVMIRMAK
jgi:hypothetical protein